MTRKYFRALAAAIRKIKSDENRREIAKTIGEECAKENERFDWKKWDEACGVRVHVNVREDKEKGE